MEGYKMSGDFRSAERVEQVVRLKEPSIFIKLWRLVNQFNPWRKRPESNLEKHARRELEIIGAFSKGGDFYGGMTGEAVMELVKVFANQGHSGMSANIVRSLFSKVADFKPLSPLRGTEDEWGEPFSKDGARQNKRCSRVFMDGDGSAYDIAGKVFREPSGVCYTNRDSRVSITFPYIPKTEIVDVPAGEDFPGE